MINFFNSRIIFIVIFLMAMAGIMIGYLAVHNPIMLDDSFMRLLPMQNLMAGKGFTANPNWMRVQPAYGFIAYIGYLITNDIEHSVILISVISTLLSIPVIFVAARIFFDAKTAILASLLFACSPTVLRFSHQTLTESLFTLFLLLGFMLHGLIVLHGPTRRWCVAHGLVTSLIWLTRTEGVLPAMLSHLFLLGHLARHVWRGTNWSGIPVKIAGRHILFSILVYGLIMTPWLIMLRVGSGYWQIGNGNSGSIHNTKEFYSMYSVPDAANNVKVIPFEKYIVYIKENHQKFILQGKQALQMLFDTYASSLRFALVPLLFLCLLVFFFPTQPLISASHWNKQYVIFFYSILIFISPIPLLLILFEFLSRYFYPYMPFFLIIIAHLIARLIEIIPVSARILWGITLALFLAHLTLPIPGFYYKPELTTLFEAKIINKWGVRMAGLWINQHCVKNNNSLRLISPASMTLLAFYASGKQMLYEKTLNVKLLNMPNLGIDLPSAAQKITQGEVDYFVLDSYYAPLHPNFSSPLWKHPELAPDYGLSLIHQDPGKNFLIFGAIGTLCDS